MTLAEFFEFVVTESRRLEIEINGYIGVFNEIKRLGKSFPEHASALEALGLTPAGLDGALVAAKSAPFLGETMLSKYDLILEKLHPHGAPYPDLKAVETWIADQKIKDLN